MQKIRTNEAYWSESDQRWRIYVQKNGVRRSFVSDKALSQRSNRKGKLQAERKADKWLETQLDDENQKVEVLFDKWIESLKERTSKPHWSQYEQYGRNWIKPAIGHKRMTAINENDFDSIIAAAYRHGLAKKTLQNIRSCINAFLKYARKARVTTLIADDIIIPKNAPKKPSRILSPNEIAIVYRSSETVYYNKVVPDFYINLYRFLVFEGLRPGEVLGLRWSDFDDTGYFVSRSVNTDNEITSGKNENAQRRHALSAFSKKLISDQKALLKSVGIVSMYVFPNKDGSVAIEHSVYKAWRRYCEHNKIRPISLYELRHTNFSVNKQMPAAYKKLLFGHSKNFDGDTVYNHLLDGDLEIAAKMNEDAFLQIINA